MEADGSHEAFSAPCGTGAVRRYTHLDRVLLPLAAHAVAARLRELEACAAQVEDLTEARAIAAEVSAVQTEAADEAGVDRRAGG
ncbi:hypothetical protein [Streptomyces iranensis]|uniref:Uncharacterized protein n=1 Tax=Streptomyces iranensis TaxID=576784 RepID=A0ABS4MWF3_9ACTN|nr:hypothetical protein [Streptomyces iranensis]